MASDALTALQSSLAVPCHLSALHFLLIRLRVACSAEHGARAHVCVCVEISLTSVLFALALLS